MIALDEVAYTAQATVTGGRAEGHARSDDGVLDVQLRRPTALGGPGGATNPEQLFAAGYAACFQAALGVVAGRRRVAVASSQVTCRVSLGPVGERFGLRAELVVELPGVEPAPGAELVAAAHEICPYSNAVRGNIEVAVRLVD